MELRVENLPRPADRSLYQEAIDTYLELSHKYIDALYVFGNVKYPGLSDLDLLVVPKNSYLAPLCVHLKDRLPHRFDRIIEHEAFVIPKSQLRVCGYRTPEKFKLAYGRDLIAGLAGEASVATRLCDTVELIHNKLVYLGRLQRTRVLNAESCMRVFNSHQYNIRRLTDLGLGEEDGYAVTVDALRTEFMAHPTSDCVVRMYDAFEQSVTACARCLQSRLGLDPHSVSQVAALSQGQAAVPFDGFEIEDVRKRAGIITAYLRELVRRNYWYGFMFLGRLFPTPPANSLFDRVVYRSLRTGSRRWRRLRSLSPITPIRGKLLRDGGPALV